MSKTSPTHVALNQPIQNVTKTLFRDGACIIGNIDNASFEKLLRLADALPPGEFVKSHIAIPQVQEIIDDSSIQSILSQYFGFPPVIREANITVSASGKHAVRAGQNNYHLDYAGWKSLNLFVYLSDVGDRDSYHSVLLESWKDSFLNSLLPRHKTEKEDGSVVRKYKKLDIKGKAGTVFLVNTESLHKRNFSTKKRVMLNVLFSASRGFISAGRYSQSRIEQDQALLYSLQTQSTQTCRENYQSQVFNE